MNPVKLLWQNDSKPRFTLLNHYYQYILYLRTTNPQESSTKYYGTQLLSYSWSKRNSCRVIFVKAVKFVPALNNYILVHVLYYELTTDTSLEISLISR